MKERSTFCPKHNNTQLHIFMIFCQNIKDPLLLPRTLIYTLATNTEDRLNKMFTVRSR